MKSSDQTLKEPQRIIGQIKDLLKRQRIIQELAAKQSSDDNSLAEDVSLKQFWGEIATLVNRLHPSDLANFLEQLPYEESLLVWQQVDTRLLGAVLLETSDSLRKALLSAVSVDELITTVSHLERDDIVDLVQDLPEEFSTDLLSALPDEQRDDVTRTLKFPENTVGAWMGLDYMAVSHDLSIDKVIEKIRLAGSLSDPSGKLLVVDNEGQFKGLLLVTDLLLKNGDVIVEEVMETEVPSFYTSGLVNEAARDFERYELTVAPVLNQHGKVVGVIEINPLMDWMTENDEHKLMIQAGLGKEEGLFEPIMQSAKNRWPWIALNLCIAFIATQVIGQFANTISGMVALAALLPITANIGGNTGNQVGALVIRGLALKQLDRSNLPRLLIKEISIAGLNGLLWGFVAGVVTYFMYGEYDLSLVMMLAMTLSMVMAACVGMMVPLFLKLIKQDPVLGSSIITTGFTDNLGFLIFLGLATILIHMT